MPVLCSAFGILVWDARSRRHCRRSLLSAPHFFDRSRLAGSGWVLAMALALPMPVLAATAVDVAFSPNPVAPGTTSTLTFNFLNSGAAPVAINPVSPGNFTLPAGLTFASGTVADSCGFTGSSAIQGGTAFVIGTDGTLPGNDGRCSVSFTVQTPTAGGGQGYTLSIPAAVFATDDGSNPPSSAQEATLVTASFQPIAIGIASAPHGVVGNDGGPLSDTAENRSITYTLTNPNLTDVTGAAIALSMPPFMLPSGEPMSTTCAGGSISANGGLSGATIPANGSCTVTIPLALHPAAFGGGGDVTAQPSNAGVFSTMQPAGTLTSDQGVTNSASPMAYVGGQNGLAYGKTFDVQATELNQVVTMTLPVISYSSYPIGYSISDPIPSGFSVQNITVQPGTNPADSGDTCTVPAFPATPGPTLVFSGTLGAVTGNPYPGSGGYTPVTSSCTYTVTLIANNVTFGSTPPASLVQTYTNTLPNGDFTDASGGGGSQTATPKPASATVSVINCDPNVTPCGGAGLKVSKSYTDTTGAVFDMSSANGDDGSLGWGGDGYFTITIRTNGGPASNVNLSDTFTQDAHALNPTVSYYATVAAPTSYLAAASTTCGGVLTATPGETGFTLSEGSIDASGSCKVIVPVHLGQGATFGNGARFLVNTLRPGDAYATVGPNTLVDAAAVKASVSLGSAVGIQSSLNLSNNTIVVGGSAQLTLTIDKSAKVAPIVDGDFLWNLSQGIAAAIVATDVVSTTCGPNLQVVDYSAGVDGAPIGPSAPSPNVHIKGIQTTDGTPQALAGYSVADQPLDPNAYRNQTCQIVLNIKHANTVAGSFNMPGYSQSFNNNAQPSVAGYSSLHSPGLVNQPILILAPSPVSITKTFAPAPATAGEPVTLAVTLDNSSGNVVDLTGIRFTDAYPAGLVNSAAPAVALAAAAGHSCSGIGTGTLTAAAAGGSVAWTGGSMRAGDVCVLQVTVLALASGVTNTIYATAGEGHEASLINDQGVVTTNFSAPLSTTQSIGVTKQFSPDAVWAGQSSALKITLVNFYANDTDAGSLRVADVGGWPAGLTATSVVSTSCGIVATLEPAGNGFTLSGGQIPAGGSCAIEIAVTGSAPGAYTNTIDAGEMTASVSGVAASNSSAASAPLTVYAPLTITKTVASSDGRVTGVSGTFNFTIGNCADPRNAAGAVASVALNNSLTGSASVNGLVPDTCTISEAAPTNPPANYEWVPESPRPVTLTAEGPNAVAFTNRLSRQVGAIALAKTISGGPASGVSATFNFNADCSASNDGVYSGAISVTAAASGNASIANVPAGANCIVSEVPPAAGSAPANYQWGPTPAPVTLAAVSPAGPNTATFVNALNRVQSGLRIDKSVTGGPSSGLAATFTFTTNCSNPNGPVDGSPFTSVIPIASPATTGSVSLTTIPAGSSCTVTETAPTAAAAPIGYVWGATPAAQTVEISATPGSNTAAFINTLTQQFGELVVTKVLNGGPSGYGGNFPLTVACASNGVPVTPAEGDTQSVAATGSAPGTATFTRIPQGASCTVSENVAALTPPPGYRFAAPAVVQSGGTIGASPSSASVTNTLDPALADLNLTVAISGGPTAGYGGNFSVSVICTLQGAPVGGIVPASPSTVAASTGTAGMVDYAGVPQGAVCRVSQGALPPPPTGYVWGTPAITQPGTIQSVDGAGANVAGTANRASIVNPLMPVAVPVSTTPVPLDARWMFALLGLVLSAAAMRRIGRARKR